MNTLSTAHDTLGDVADTMGDLGADLVDDLTDVAEVAIDTIASTSRVGVRVVGRSLRFVARHPREVLAGVALIVVLSAVLGYMKSNSTDSASA